ncbi:hypothetical protein [Natronosalvus vescus]|uniref:hypothetical protein n=1 Tax=Natronosalvus vescus TaxID=2953881 RepID=UPI002091242F|nr:hypothetical protein [Natronosalvus vescus]
MSEDQNADTVRCWLVERTFDDRNLVTTVYATPDGSRYRQRERSATALQNGAPVTAATAIQVENLEPVPDAETRERYASEASRVASQHDPDDEL